ncbi:MAG TPA: transglutaminase domain-containing protein [Jatrophihabitans sp.]|nr:transglutaminase domain-containing protein [Jatrophihabitans sp.]
MIRRAIPFSLAPLAILATGLSSSMWLRAFPAATLAIPLYGAAVLSVGFTYLLVSLTRRPMWLTVPAGTLAFLLYSLVVVLRSPVGFADLVHGFVDGPSQLLSFALPLVSPRSLMVWPVALAWLAGLLAGESLARSRLSLLPYGTWLAVFATGYAGGSRAMGPDPGMARRVDLAVGAALLVVLVLLRVAQGWLAQDERSEAAGRVVSSEDAASLNLLPLQRIAAGLLTAAVVAGLAVWAAGSSTFAGAPTVVKRVPSVINADPTTPMAYVAALRPADRKDPGTPLFDVTVTGSAPGYFALASVDYYDGDSWTFTRSFRPSGGVVPADTDPELASSAVPVDQRIQLRSDLISRTPWLPAIYRPQKVSGVAISVDPGSGMIVPTHGLSADSAYTVRSVPPAQTLTELPATWLPATSAAPVDSQLPGTVRTTLASVVAGFATETGKASVESGSFLQAVTQDLRTNYLLTDPAAAASAAASASASAARASGTSAAPRKPTGKGATAARSSTAGRSSTGARKARPSASPTVTASAGAIGGTSFSAVLAAILGPQRSGTPEQYATLVALLARDLGIPARIVSGFRVTEPGGGHQLSAGSYTLTTKDAYSWVEIPVRGAGWVVLDPSPTRYADSNVQPSVGVSKTPTPSRTPSQAALVTQSDGGHAVAPKSVVQAAATHRGGWALVLVIPALVLAALALVLLALLARRRVRLYRRRHESDARRRVITAWQETLDVLTESGLGDLRALTGSEVRQATGERFGNVPAEQVKLVAAAADQAAFSLQSVVLDRDAEQAWQAHTVLRRAVRRELPWRDRLLATLRYTSGRAPTRPPGPRLRRTGRPGRSRKH